MEPGAARDRLRVHAEREVTQLVAWREARTGTAPWRAKRDIAIARNIALVGIAGSAWLVTFAVVNPDMSEDARIVSAIMAAVLLAIAVTAIALTWRAIRVLEAAELDEE